MIKYKLACKSIYCKKENDFEAWFQNIESYETQKKSGLINCPRCGGSDVIKLLTAPSLNKLSNQDLGNNSEKVSANIPKTNQNFEQKIDVKNITTLLRAIKKKIQKNSTYVGNEFVTQARSMKLGKIEEKPIHGHGSKEEIEGLRDEGIEVVNIPWVADDH
jgi:hypothetical protein